MYGGPTWTNFRYIYTLVFFYPVSTAMDGVMASFSAALQIHGLQECIAPSVMHYSAFISKKRTVAIGRQCYMRIAFL